MTTQDRGGGERGALAGRSGRKSATQPITAPSHTSDTPSAPTPRCSCGRVCFGSTVTETRNWNPDCAEHGVGSDWYRSADQIEKRRVASERLRDLQVRARAARRAAQAGRYRMTPTCPGCGCLRADEAVKCRQCHRDGCAGCLGDDGLCDLCFDIERERNT